MNNSDDTESSDDGGTRRRISGFELLNNISAMITHASSRLSDHSSSASRESSESGNVQTTFDKSLAARHEYLGNDLEELRGRTVHDEGSVLWLPILLELGVVLVPGQTLPLTVFYHPTIAMLREVISKDKTFAVVCVRNVPFQKKALAQYGTTAEIFQYQEENDLAGFKIKAKGRQRFKLLEQKRHMPGILSGKVLILPEITLPSPLHCGRLESLDRHRGVGKLKRKLAYYDASMTRWPDWVYKQYDAHELVNKVLNELKNFQLDVSNTNLPSDPLDLSYWLAQNLPIDDVHRVGMLGLNTAIERLQYALTLLAKCQKLYCAHCGNYAADRKDAFSMSVEGPQGTYCNPGGHVHEIVTLYKAHGMTLAPDDPSTQYSWFPGYGWTIASCAHCDRHMGWLFTAMSSDLKPAKFWGLSRRSVTTHHKDMSASQDESDEVPINIAERLIG